MEIDLIIRKSSETLNFIN